MVVSELMIRILALVVLLALAAVISPSAAEAHASAHGSDQRIAVAIDGGEHHPAAADPERAPADPSNEDHCPPPLACSMHCAAITGTVLDIWHAAPAREWKLALAIIAVGRDRLPLDRPPRG